MLKSGFLIVIALFLMTGCQSMQKTTHFENTSNSADTSEVEYFNSLKAAEWTVTEGIKGDAYRLLSDAEHSIESEILNHSDTSTISFWIKPDNNRPDIPVFSIVNGKGEIMKLTTMSVKEDGTAQGMVLQMKTEGQESFLVSNSEFTMNTHRYNQIVLVMEKQHATLYLNGQQIISDSLGAAVNDIDHSWLVIGKDAIAYGECMTGQFQNFQIRKKALSQQEVTDEFERFYPEVLLDEIHFDQQDDLRENLILYPEVDSQYPAEWTSSAPEFLLVEDNEGKVTVPTEEQGDQNVTLTVTSEIMGRTFAKSFDFLIRAESAETFLYRDTKALPIEMGFLVNQGQTLPEKGMWGSQIEWTVNSGPVRIDQGKICKNDPEDEKVAATLQAVISQGSEKNVVDLEVTVLDEYEGYILSYFNGELGKETGKLAYSMDGLHWTDLNQGKTILYSRKGTGRIRDPFITRDKEGNFVILATEGYDNPSIYVGRDDDLVDIEELSLHRIAYFDKGLHTTGERAWAPEMVYDPAADEYIIIYSDAQDSKSGSMFAVRTQDFNSYSYPESLFNPGYKVIDGTVFVLDGQYRMIYKDEREAAQTLFHAATENLSSGFQRKYDEFFIYNRKYIEGPFTMPILNEPGSYYLYVDNYPNEKFYVARFSSLDGEGDFQWLDESEYSLPNTDVRHGSAVAVTGKELRRIIEAYK